ncbi:MAG: aspartate carbamoyltransferase [Clostridiales bacterium]|nr:aspartate carbamoyltransferase [Clostridiales bacterium]
MQRKFNHLIDLEDYPKEKWNQMIELAQDIMKSPASFSEKCKGKIMATLFYEPSTRTQMSFQTAMIKLGGSIIGFDNPDNSSVSKGENLKDTIKIVSGYSDILVMRSPLEGAAKVGALVADCPVINAGDGGHLHPTQTLTDLLTLKIQKGRLDNLKIGFCGDLKNGRTVHSLVKALSCYNDNEFTFISTKKLEIPLYIKNYLSSKGISFNVAYSIEEAIESLDVLYMTRIQKERFSSEEEYISQKNVYILDAEKMKLADKDMIVLHPLPRVDEITIEVDDDSRAMYFKQANNGVYIRMALILSAIEGAVGAVPLFSGKEFPEIICTNEKCVTHKETYLPHNFTKNGDMLECEYCEQRILMK